jgi:hypothetical protein
VIRSRPLAIYALERASPADRNHSWCAAAEVELTL